MNYALKLDNVCKTYETSDFLLDNVSFEVPMGSVMGFVGENGAGKTTTIGLHFEYAVPQFWFHSNLLRKK